MFFYVSEESHEELKPLSHTERVWYVPYGINPSVLSRSTE